MGVQLGMGGGGGGGGYGTRMSVKSNDGGGGGGGGNSARPAVVLQISLLSVFNWYCMEVPDPNLERIIQYLHFLNTTVIVSLMDCIKYTYQGFIQ